MAWTAKCENADCSKEPWKLQKNPGQYKRGVTCPDCGTTKVHVEQTDSGGGDVPARKPQQQETAPAQAGGGGMSGTQTAIALLDSDVDTEKRAEAVDQAAGIIGNAARELLNYQNQKKQAQDQRAQNAELEKAVQYPECECGYQFDGEDIGLSDETVRCPDCDMMWNVVDVGQSA